MTRTTLVWVALIMGLSFYGSIAVLIGFTPGANSGIAFFERIAAIIADVVDKQGRAFASFGIFLFGIVLSALCVVFPGREGNNTWIDGDGGGD